MPRLTWREACGPARSLASDRRGQVSVIFGLAAVALTGAVGLSLDVAAMNRAGAQLQDATDAAALHALRAGTSRNLSEEQMGEAAVAMLQASYGGQAGAEDTTVTLETVSRSPFTVEVTTSQPVQLPFGFLHGAADATVSRTATAAEAVKTPVSLLLLGSGAGAWMASGGSTVTLENGAAVVNSTSSQALQGSGGANIVSTATLVAGPTQAAEQWTPKPTFDAAPVTDPYADKIQWPDIDDCEPENAFKNETVTLDPGTYCGGLSLKTHANVTLRPGVYVLTGPLSVTSQSRLNAPAGVTIVLTGDTSNINVQAGSELIVDAPESGPWKDIAIAQAPQSTEVTSSLNGGGEMDVDGVIYLPTQKLTLTGGGQVGVKPAKRIVIVNRLQTKGNGEVYLKGDPDVLATNVGARIAR